MADSPFPSGRWRARWIWCESPKLELRASAPIPVSRLDVEASRRFGAFRRTFDLDAVPDAAPARIAADSRYVLWVNGAELARGPIRAHGAKLHYVDERRDPFFGDETGAEGGGLGIAG